jgi:hypothetical protein
MSEGIRFYTVRLVTYVVCTRVRSYAFSALAGS